MTIEPDRTRRNSIALLDRCRENTQKDRLIESGIARVTTLLAIVYAFMRMAISSSSKIEV